MKILDSNESFMKQMDIMSRSKPTYFYMASYKIRVSKQLNAILANLPAKCDKRIVVGYDEITPKSRAFLTEYFTKYGFKIQLLHGTHTKLVVSDKHAIIGGRNITESEWIDLSFLTVVPKEIKKIKNKYQ